MPEGNEGEKLRVEDLNHVTADPLEHSQNLRDIERKVQDEKENPPVGEKLEVSDSALGDYEKAVGKRVEQNLDTFQAQAKAEAEAAGEEINLPTAPGDTPGTPAQ